MKIRVTLNGTDANPWHRLNLTQNPFPQIGRAEFDAADRMLASLDGDPITGPADIRDRLKGCDPKFIEGVIARFVPGQRTRFIVEFPEQR
jgi:hypothetical protein